MVLPNFFTSAPQFFGCVFSQLRPATIILHKFKAHSRLRCLTGTPQKTLKRLAPGSKILRAGKGHRQFGAILNLDTNFHPMIGQWNVHPKTSNACRLRKVCYTWSWSDEPCPSEMLPRVPASESLGLSTQFVPRTYSSSSPKSSSTERSACTWHPTPMKRSRLMSSPRTWCVTARRLRTLKMCKCIVGVIFITQTSWNCKPANAYHVLMSYSIWCSAMLTNLDKNWENQHLQSPSISQHLPTAPATVLPTAASWETTWVSLHHISRPPRVQLEPKKRSRKTEKTQDHPKARRLKMVGKNSSSNQNPSPVIFDSICSFCMYPNNILLLSRLHPKT